MKSKVYVQLAKLGLFMGLWLLVVGLLITDEIPGSAHGTQPSAWALLAGLDPSSIEAGRSPDVYLAWLARAICLLQEPLGRSCGT